MDELQSSGSISTAVDQVEIFDNGEHLGFADVVEGQWTLPDTYLPGGMHTLTAKYKGLTTKVWWMLMVQETVHLDDFQSASLGRFENIVRPYYRGETRYVGYLGVSGPTAIFYVSWAGAGKWLHVMSAKNSAGYGSFSTVYTMTFNELYTKVSFDFKNSIGNGGSGSGQVEALSEDGVRVAIHNFPSAEHTEGVVSLVVSNRQFIKYLVFRLSAISDDMWYDIRVDNIRMIK